MKKGKLTQKSLDLQAKRRDFKPNLEKERKSDFDYPFGEWTYREKWRKIRRLGGI